MGHPSDLPVVSIVIPAYNRKDILAKTLPLLLKQKGVAYEVILVDDGSKDGTEAFVEAMLKEHPALKYIHHANAERGYSRNAGMKAALANYILFLDSDDLLYEGALVELMKMIEAHPGYALYASRYDFIQEDGTRKPSDLATLPAGEYGIDTIVKGNAFACNFCVDKRKNIIPFHEDRSYAAMEDWIFLVENLMNRTIYLGEKVTTGMQDHPDRSMRAHASVLSAKRLKATEYLDGKLALSAEQKKDLWYHSTLFCAIHYYIDGDRKNALRYLRETRKYKTPGSDYWRLMLKFMIGKPFIHKIQNAFR